MSEESELRSKPFNYELDDLVALSKLVGPSRRRMFLVGAGGIVILAVFAMVVQIYSMTGFIDWTAIAVCLFAAVLMVVFTDPRMRSRFWLRLVKRGPFYAPHSYAILPAGLRISSPKSVSDIRWSALPDVKRAGDRLFLFMTKRQAFIIPRRAFDSDEEFKRFITAAEERWKAHHRL